MAAIPQQLEDIRDFLAEKRMKLVTGNENHRIDAVQSHTKIIKLLSKQFSIELPESPSSWFSFAIAAGRRWFPVKIKVSRFSRADNLNCKLGIYFALTGIRPEFSDEIEWDGYFRLLEANLSENVSTDLLFLVVNRNNSSDVFCSSLKSIEKLIPNGNNLPFQCKWAENRDLSARSHKDATNYILEKLEQSAQLRAEAFQSFKRYFP